MTRTQFSIFAGVTVITAIFVFLTADSSCKPPQTGNCANSWFFIKMLLKIALGAVVGYWLARKAKQFKIY